MGADQESTDEQWHPTPAVTNWAVRLIVMVIAQQAIPVFVKPNGEGPGRMSPVHEAEH